MPNTAESLRCTGDFASVSSFAKSSTVVISLCVYMHTCNAPSTRQLIGSGSMQIGRPVRYQSVAIVCCHRIIMMAYAAATGHI